MSINYKTRRESCQILGIHYHTLYKLAEKGEIQTMKIGDQQRYNIDKYIRDNKLEKENKRRICYCRVSSNKQKEDLKRQVEYMKNNYPTYEVISDIGSGLNFKRKGLNKIIDYAIKGEVEVVIVAYKDRLARFGYDMIERLVVKYSNGTIRVENKKKKKHRWKR